jgi:hypothetical protein
MPAMLAFVLFAMERKMMDNEGIDESSMILLNIAMVLALALSLSLAAPTEQFALTFSAVCSLAGVVVGIVAAVQREKPFKAHLTNWDSTAFFYAMSIFANLFDHKHGVETAQTLSSVVG